MQLKTITNAKDAPIPGVQFVKTDKAITEVIIGGLRIRKGESYSSALQVLIEAPFEEAKRFRMTATVEGFDPKVEYHETSYEAGTAASSFEDKGAQTAVEEVTVLLDADGQVVSSASRGELTAPHPADADKIPF